MSERELDKHYLKFYGPHIYECSCGVVMYWHPDGTQKLAEMPKSKIEYMVCGHAKCAYTARGCIICINTGKE